MSRPTEPGHYWMRRLRDEGEWRWEVVRVKPVDWDGGQLHVFDTHGMGGSASLSSYHHEQWGGKIVQEPALDAPPPF